MIYDITMDIRNDMPVYKNRQEKRPVHRVVRDFASSGFYESRIDMDLHTGTHIDAPLHMIEKGSGVEGIGLRRLMTKCRVLDFTELDGKISKSHLEKKTIKPGDFVLLKTKNSYSGKFIDDFVYLDHTGAEYLRDCKASGVGIDALGIERDQPDHPTHKILLGHGIVILEGLRLAAVNEGEYILLALPLKVAGAEAAPVRAVLLDTGESIWL